MTTSSGEPTGAVYGFALMLLDLLRTQKPDYLVVALEGGRTFRHEAFVDYKANRVEMPDDFGRQVGRVRELIDALSIPTAIREGYEADDVIGSLVDRCARDAQVDVIVVTGDSDLLQLVQPGVTAVLPGTMRFSQFRYYDVAAVVERFGFGPEYVADYKALVGDTSDNIPGVPGIGEKTAKALIAQFGHVEEILDHVAEVTPTRARTALEANAEQAIHGKRLTTIVRDLEVALDLDHARISNYDRDEVVALFRELGFRSLLNKLPEPMVKSTKPVSPTVQAVRTAVRTPADLARLVERLRSAEAVAVDVETDSTDPMRARLVGIALATSPVESFYVPLTHRSGDQLSEEEVRAALDPLLADRACRILTHHGKYDIQVLRRHGYTIDRTDADTMVAAYLVGETSHGLKSLAFNRLGIEMTEIEALIGTGRNQLTMDQVDSDVATEYACGDVEATFGLVEPLERQVVELGQESLYRDEELPLIPVLIDMERAGIAIDSDYLNAFSAEIGERFAELERIIHGHAGRQFNVGSTKQLGQLLFEELKLPTGRRTKTGFSVDSDVLESIRDRHPIIEAILEHRQLQKLKSTYVDALPASVNPETGRVHTNFNQTVAQTGRLSSMNPNLQNIPVRTELGRRVRRAFVADHRPGHRLFPNAILLSVDYSQIELRLLAHMSEEPFLVEAFREGQDIHRATAATVYGVELGEVTPAMRSVAKTVNFGVMYGMQSYGLSRDTGLSRADSQKFIDDYWARLPRARQFFDATLEFGRSKGYVAAPSGRRRYFPDLLSDNGAKRLPAERQAINMPIQGTAADIMKLAMIRVFHALHEYNLPARMLLQVHDELVLEIDRNALEETAGLVVRTMEGAYPLIVPLVAEVRAGENWNELQPLEIARVAA
jgi:DNA polymerase I